MRDYLKLVKFSHTIFALPFALVGYFLGVMEMGQFHWNILVLVLLCMVFARNAAMSFNRWADRYIDAKNPRTASREIPAGILEANKVLAFTIFNSLAFIFTTYFINSICFYLSPVALFVVLGYSYAKRFTSFAHFILGIGLSLAPVGAYLAITGSFATIPIVFGIIVFTWVAGFDIIYALQDEEVDTDLGLFSIPSTLGKKNALRLSIFVHIVTGLSLLIAAYLCTTQYQELGFIFGLGSFIFFILIFYQHTLVSPSDLSKVNLAFFKTNGLASLMFGLLFIIDVLF